MFTMFESETVLMITLMSRARSTGSRLQTTVGAIVVEIGEPVGRPVGLEPAIGALVGMAVGICVRSKVETGLDRTANQISFVQIYLQSGPLFVELEQGPGLLFVVLGSREMERR